MRYLNAAELRRLVSDADYCSLVESAYRIYGAERQVTSRPPASIVTAAHEPTTLFPIKGAVSVEREAVGVFFGAHYGEYYFAVCDSRTGELRGLVEQSASTKTRTAATAAVTASLLSRPDSKIAAVIGGGQIAAEIVRLLEQRFKLERIRIASRTLEGATAFTQQCQPHVAAHLQPVASVAEAVAGADIVITITVAPSPVIHAGMLKRGSLLCSMGGVPEVDHAVLKEVDRLVVDDIGYALLRGDLGYWVERGDISRAELEKRIDADIGSIACGRAPARQGDETIMAVIQGMAICDLVIAQAALEKAAQLGIGVDVPVTQQMARQSETKLRETMPRLAGDLQRRADAAGR